MSAEQVAVKKARNRTSQSDQESGGKIKHEKKMRR